MTDTISILASNLTEALRHVNAYLALGLGRTPVVGATVRVRYLPSNPTVAYIQSFLHMWAAPVACALLGIGALAALRQH